MILAPLLAVGLGALVMVAFVLATEDGRTFKPRWPLAGFVSLAALCWVLMMDSVSPSLLVSLEVAGKGVGLALAGLAAALALLGSRAKGRADMLRGSAPRELDEAVAQLRAGRAPGWGVYRGRLGASAPVTSPGGVECAFYEADLRAAGAQGRQGPLISREQAYALLITLRGERAEAAVSFAPSKVAASVRVRRCQAEPRLPGLEAGGPGEEQPEEEVWSYERVGTLGEPCLVVGELRPGPAPGSYVLSGRQGGPAMLVLGDEGPGLGQDMARRAWGFLSAAGALCVAAVFVLSRFLG